MTNPEIAFKVNIGEDGEAESSLEKIKKTYTEEMVIGICFPIGSLAKPVIESLEKHLITDYGYTVKVLKLSDFILKHINFKSTTVEGQGDPYTHLLNKIKGGNLLRKKFNNAVLAELAISEINIDRNLHFTVGGVAPPVTDLKSRRICYIIDSLKNHEELKLLRSAYRDLFYLFSIYSPDKERVDELLTSGLSKPEINRIISTDTFENNDFGQNVRGTFVEGDFFIRASKKSLEDIDKKITRYLNLIFNTDVVTPYMHEIAMYAAKSAAGNSACLSRQVGAAVTDKRGDIISTGWNDVPRFGGNLYRDEDGVEDKRCKISGYCSNDKTKDTLTHDIIEKIKEDKELNDLISISGHANLLPFIDRLKEIVRNTTKVKDLIEFSRSVHAEMHALINGSQLSGSKMIGGKIFCTTYPCHNCARHIIAAGVSEIYFIEPYVKSLCIELHQDAITEDEDDNSKVRILLFDGVAPRKYLKFFTSLQDRKVKNTGDKKIVDKLKVFPKAIITLQAIPTLEAQALHSLDQAGFNINDKYGEE